MCVERVSVTHIMRVVTHAALSKIGMGVENHVDMEWDSVGGAWEGVAIFICVSCVSCVRVGTDTDRAYRRPLGASGAAGPAIRAGVSVPCQSIERTASRAPGPARRFGAG